MEKRGKRLLLALFLFSRKEVDIEITLKEAKKPIKEVLLW